MYNKSMTGSPITDSRETAEFLSNPKEAIDQIVWSDKYEKLGRLGSILATILRYLYGMLRDFFSAGLTFRAMSLVYTTLLSIVQLLAVSFALAKGLGMVDLLREKFTQSLTQLGPDGVQIAENILQMVDRINGRAIGALGVIFFLYTAWSMINKVEDSFNHVWYVSKQRSISRKFTEYLVVLLVGPVIMGAALSMIASLSSNSMVAYLETLPGIAQLFLLVGKTLPYVMIIGMFTFFYYFMPNTKVHLKSALVGGIAGGIMWATVSVVFTTFIATSFRTFAVYASFGVGIIALIWLYLNWIVLLLGAQLAFYHQNPAFLRIGRQEPRLSNSMRERLAINIMLLVGKAFRVSGANVTLPEVSSRLNISTLALEPVTQSLEANGLLLITEEEKLIPGREVSRIRLQDILDVVRGHGDTGSHGAPNWGPKTDAIGDKLDAAADQVAGDKTLADLLDEIDSAES